MISSLTRQSWILIGIVAMALLASVLAVKGCTGAHASTLNEGNILVSSGVLSKLDAPAPLSPIGHRRFVRTENILKLEKLERENPSEERMQRLASAYLEVGDFARASQVYYKLASFFMKKGDVNSGLAEIKTAQQYETQTAIYREVPSDAAALAANFSGARNEPIYGCYNGAFIDHEISLKKHILDGSVRRDVGQFNKLTGTQHATYFIYIGYGKPFPKEWIAHIKEHHAMAQLAFEPTSYEQVKDDAYLHKFARDAKASGIPIFLRFASEMNGDWVAYHPSPKRYIQMFRLVSKVMHEETDNVAMVWCPFEIPQRYILPYYPGKDAVDWVGLNVYSVLYNDNDPGRNAQERNPADGIRFIYKKFAKDHPIMIGEFGAAKMSSLDMVPRSDYAIMKLRQLYASLPLLYPRVKAVHWLSMNAIKHADPGRQLNDYSLIEDADIAKAYKDANSLDYYLKEFKPKAVAPIRYQQLSDDDSVSGNVPLRAWVKTYTNLPTVVWLVDGHEVARSSTVGMYPLSWDSTKHANGPAQLELVVLDRQGFEARRESVTVNVQN